MTMSHVSLVDRTESHAHGLLVDYRNGDIYIVGPVEIGNDAIREIRVGIAVVVRKLVDEVKRFEFVVGIVILPAVVEIEIPYGDLTVILILEALDFPIPFRFFLEDRIPSVDTVKRPVELVLLELAILPVLFCNLVLVPYLHVQVPVGAGIWLPAVLVAVVCITVLF